MKLSDVVPGGRVVFTPTDHFFAYVAGWQGQVQGLRSGLVEVLCVNPEGQPVTFFAPASELDTIRGLSNA